MKPCTSLKKDGNPCLAKAVSRDPDSRCVFHSKLDFSTAKTAREVTKEEVIKTIGREMRRLRRLKDLPPLQRASEIRNLILVWQSLTAPEVEPPAKPLTFAERVAEFESGR